jgi:hypothetical protein
MGEPTRRPHALLVDLISARIEPIVEKLDRVAGDVIPERLAPIAEKLDRTTGWDRLPPGLGLAALVGIRHRLRERNLYDTGRAPTEAATASAAPSPVRTLDGTGNDPGDPAMGSAGSPFGRNAPPLLEDDERLHSPNALEVSERLLTRHTFFPAESINLLAAAWLQFEVHDWFAHRTDPDSAYARVTAGMPEGVPAPPAPLARETRIDAPYPPFVSDQTHWWDASQLYGAREDFAAAVRAGEGRVKQDDELLKAMEPYTVREGGTTPAAPNLWLGTALFHDLFAKEHNAICDLLRSEHPTWNGERLYEQARLINAAVMAKIHTVEWTPAIIAHPAASRGVQATWWGLLGPAVRRRLGRVSSDEILSGIRGSRQCHDGAPYALTEEFVAVYRMHQLIPDDVTFRRVADHAEMETLEFEQLAVARGDLGRPRASLTRAGPANAFYSLGVANPGEITLHNHPAFLQRLEPADEPQRILNLGEVDILRTRQTGIPRYNDFRRLFRLEPAASFHDVANGNPQWAKEIRDVYSGRLEDVDLLIGMFAERKPRGFAFSDTAFRVFLLMAARRLRSDRFFTTDYTADVYTPEGLRWIDDASLARMLQRHHPELGDALSGVRNPFEPWRPSGS